MLYLRLFVVVLVFLSFGCSGPSEYTVQKTVDSESVVLLLSHVADNDSGALVSFVQMDFKSEGVVAALKDIQWRSGQPQPFSNLQFVESNDARLQIDAKFNRQIREIGIMFDKGLIDQKTYVDVLKIVGAVLVGVLRSHKDIDDPTINISSSALTYACLARGGIFQEMERRSLDQFSFLQPKQVGVLTEIARTREYGKLDNLP